MNVTRAFEAAPAVDSHHRSLNNAAILGVLLAVDARERPGNHIGGACMCETAQVITVQTPTNEVLPQAQLSISTYTLCRTQCEFTPQCTN